MNKRLVYGVIVLLAASLAKAADAPPPIPAVPRDAKALVGAPRPDSDNVAARIEQFNPHKTSTMEFWDFKLVANCADWQCDAALRMKGTLEAWLVSCGRHNVNPWVYAPMLPETAEYEALVYGKRQA